jgi:hypothetical protein
MFSDIEADVYAMMDTMRRGLRVGKLGAQSVDRRAAARQAAQLCAHGFGGRG